MLVLSHLLIILRLVAAAPANATTEANATSTGTWAAAPNPSSSTGHAPTPDKNNPDMNPVPHSNKTVSVTLRFGEESVNITGVSESGVDNFLGIPYAQPPVGNLRFAAPQPAHYNSSIDATTPQPACMQTTMSPAGNMTGKHGMSEDCLTLNILAPSERPADLPVLVYIHGGGFFGGTATLYNSPFIIWHSQKIGKPFMLVTVNYRLGIFGWGYGEEMKARGAANLGLRDQTLALQWVQDNIKAFGGDPQRVTLMGESAGSMSTSMLLLNETSDLFRGAIMQSGVSSRFSINEGAWQERYASIAKVAGCPRGVGGGNHTDEGPHIMSEMGGSGATSPAGTTEGTASPSKRIWFNSTFDCLKSRPAEALNNASTAQFDIGGIMFGPKIDGDLIPADPIDLWYQGKMRQVPLIVGDTLDEGTMSTPPTVNSSQALEMMVLGNYPPEFRQKVMAAYPDDPAQGSPFGTGNETFGLSPVYKKAAAIAGDVTFHADRRQLLRQYNAHGFTRTWTYQFEAHSPGLPPRLGVAHGTDVLFSFGGVSTALNFTQTDVDLQNEMMTRFVNFVYHLDPNGAPMAAEGGGGSVTSQTGAENSSIAVGEKPPNSKPDSKTSPFIVWRPHTAEDWAIIHWAPGNVTMGQDNFREESMKAIYRDSAAGTA